MPDKKRSIPRPKTPATPTSDSGKTVADKKPAPIVTSPKPAPGGAAAPKKSPKPPPTSKPQKTPKPRALRAGPAQPRGTKTTPETLSILMIAAEAHPFGDTGELGKPAGALSHALARLGHRVTLVLPRYRGIDTTGARADRMSLPFGERSQDVTVYTREHGHLTVAFVDAPDLFDRSGLYGEGGQDYADNGWRFAVFSRAGLEYARLGGQRPAVIHAHDWQTGLVPVFQKMHCSDDPMVGGVPVVFTIHNLAFQGLFPSTSLADLGLGPEVFDVQALEYWGQISYLKGGINFSERITIVSSDARDALTPEGGFGFDGVLSRRAGALSGVVSGIEEPGPGHDDSWDVPAREYVKVYRDAGAGAPAAERLR